MLDHELDGFSDALNQAAKHLYRNDITPESIALYWMVISPVCPNLDVFRRALTAHVNDTTPVGNSNYRGSFMPKPADLVAQIAKLTGLARDPAIAWNKVEEAMRLIGKNRSVAFSDPAIHLAIQGMGGWVRLCGTLREGDFSAQRMFSDLYRDALGSVAEAPSMLLGSEDVDRLRLNPGHQVNPVQVDRAFSAGNLLLGVKQNG